MTHPNLVTYARRFSKDENGTIAFITALVFLVICVSTGAAFDYARVAHTKSKVNGALDSAVLATGNNLSLGITDKQELEKDFRAFLEANLHGSGIFAEDLVTEKFDVDLKTGEVDATISAPIKATLTRLLGYEIIDVQVSSSALFEQKETEVAMVLDVTGSMKGSKLRDLKSAAKDLIDTVLPKNQVSGVRIGIVPYANSVNVGSAYASKVTKGNDRVQTASLSEFDSVSNNIATNDCVTERAGREAATDASYKDAPLGSHKDTVSKKSSLRCPTTEILPLTNSRNTLKKRVDAFVARGYTAGHIGISWGYYMLSENWRDLWTKKANRPALYSKDVRKVVILMTDGEFNTAYEGIGNGSPFGRNVGKSNKAAKALCKDMRAAKNGNPGIIVYSVAFKAPKSAQKTLKACANSSNGAEQFYFSADNGEELRKAFKQIGQSIQTLRISG